MQSLGRVKGLAVEKSDHRRPRLLRSGRERPGAGIAAEQRDELASFQLSDCIR
jgi:hypothetical protein